MSFLTSQQGMVGDGGMLQDLALTPVNGSSTPGGSGGHMLTPFPAPAGRTAEERQLAQWGYHETKEFIQIRGELERDFVQTRTDGSKTMWEIISHRMKEKGYRRTAAQCKTKWKTLVNRYKGKEVGEGDDRVAPPFFDELDAIFKERAKHMDRLLLESTMTASGGASGGGIGIPSRLRGPKQAKGPSPGGNKRERESEEDYSAGEDHEEADDPEDVDPLPTKRKRVNKKELKSAATVQEVLEQFFIQQLKLEQEWREAVEKLEAERRMRERDWRDRMEALEKDRLLREVEWRKKEEERRGREEARAERRDKLIASLLEKLG